MPPKEAIKKIISILFPEFTNKLTWAVVAAGLGLISSSLIEQLIRIFINKNFNWHLTDGNDAIIGVIVIAIGLLHNYGYIREKTKLKYDPTAQEKQKKQKDHDKKIFAALDEFISEEFLTGHIEWILT